MEVDPDRVSLEIFTDHDDMLFVNDDGDYMSLGAAGLYEEQAGRTVIHINTTEMHDLTGLVATLAHELSHMRLIGEGRVTGDEYDNELLTDLTAVFHGFGIFMGSSPRDWVADYSSWPGSTLKRPEYMSMPMLAYTLAHAAWFREQRKPPWSPFLSSTLRAEFNQAIRYLMETGDSTFAPKKVKG